MTFSPFEPREPSRDPGMPSEQPQSEGLRPPQRPHRSAFTEADLFRAEEPPERTAAGAPLPRQDGSWWRAADDPRLGPEAAAATEGFPPQAGERTPGKSRRAAHLVWELGQTLVLALIIFLIVRSVAQNFRVEGPSMEPGLHDGQYLLVNKAVYFKLDMGTLAKYIPFLDAKDGEEKFLFHGPQRGDVVVFRYPKDPSRDFIKRVIGVPGDTVAIREGVVYVNGIALREDYTVNPGATDMPEQLVPPKSYFVLGDNRANSSDSRSWGFVPEENIIGKALFSYWPLSQLGGVGNHSLDLGFIDVPLP